MVEIIRHLQWVRRHTKWIIVRLEDNPGPATKQQA
ncbi:unnamed protein product, partial [marine sediment metagenome]